MVFFVSSLPNLRTVFFSVADNKSGISCTSAIIHTNGSIKLYQDVCSQRPFSRIMKAFLFIHMRTWNLSMAQKYNNPFVKRKKARKYSGVLKTCRTDKVEYAYNDDGWFLVPSSKGLGWQNVFFFHSECQVRTMHSIYMAEMSEHARIFIIINPNKHNGIFNNQNLSLWNAIDNTYSLYNIEMKKKTYTNFIHVASFFGATKFNFHMNISRTALSLIKWLMIFNLRWESPHADTIFSG